MTAGTKTTVVAGIGNVYRGDDGVGPVVAERLASTLPDSVQVIAGLDDPLQLIDAWEHAELAIVIDAVVSDAAPGTVHELEVLGPLPAMFRRLSTHLFSVAQVIELGTVLNRMPGRVVVIGVEAADMTQGRLELTPVVAAAVDVVMARVRKLVADRHNAFRHEVGHA
ncbi:MAG TPA: hydrogenase maturation protease [Acidimicrobiia bacterium]|jgi:hydrogenase maturation protease|nr:hydrogenase maturation protease [Acidimicrobiia bacterium]